LNVPRSRTLTFYHYDQAQSIFNRSGCNPFTKRLLQHYPSEGMIDWPTCYQSKAGEVIKPRKIAPLPMNQSQKRNQGYTNYNL